MNKLTPLHKWLIVAVIVALFNVAVGYFLLLPANEKSKDVQAQIEQQRTKQTQLQQRLADLRAIDTEYLQLESALLDMELPVMGGLSELLVELEQMANRRNLPLKSIRAGNPTREGGFIVLGLTVVLEGHYRSIYSYVEELEHHQRMLVLDSVVINGEEPEVLGTLRFRIYAENFADHTPYTAPGKDMPFKWKQ